MHFPGDVQVSTFKIFSNICMHAAITRQPPFLLAPLLW